jgi:hypothetical protein
MHLKYLKYKMWAINGDSYFCCHIVVHTIILESIEDKFFHLTSSCHREERKERRKRERREERRKKEGRKEGNLGPILRVNI